MSDIKAKKEDLKKALESWTEDDIKAHIEKVAGIYTSQKLPNKLGDFSFDPNNVYYWHTYDEDGAKLTRRLQLGWGFATREDAIAAGLIDENLNDGRTIDGTTAVEMSHKSHRAVLLKIPRELYDMNERVRERIRQNKPVLDEEGNVTQMETIETHNSVIRKRKEKMITLGD